MQGKWLSTPSPLSLRRMILIVLNYGIGYLYVYPKIAFIFVKWTNIKSPMVIIFIQFIIYFFVIISMILLASPLLKESFQVWKNNKTLIFKKNIKLILALYAGTMVISFIINLFTNSSTSNNQIDVSSSILQFPVLMAFTTMLFAPIVEEILFRGVFYRTFRARYGILCSSIISCGAFGFIHIYDSLIQGMLMDCWYFFVYAAIGYFLCQSYEETDSIFGSILLHFMNNGIAFLTILL